MGSTTKIVPITTQELGRTAARPAFSVMDCKKFTYTTGMSVMQNWKML